MMAGTELPRALVDAIAEFLIREYGLRLFPHDLDNPAHIPLAYTHADEHERYVVEVILNIPMLRLEQYINGTLTDVWEYDSVDQITDLLRHIDFSELVSLGPNAERVVYGES